MSAQGYDKAEAEQIAAMMLARETESARKAKAATERRREGGWLSADERAAYIASMSPNRLREFLARLAKDGAVVMLRDPYIGPDFTPKVHVEYASEVRKALRKAGTAEVREAEAIERERHRRAAKAALDAEDADKAFTPPPNVLLLADAPDDDDADEPMRVERLWPVDGKVTVIGPAKIGKTVLMVNLVRCLADGAPFLDAFTVTPPAGRVVVLNYEVSERTYLRALRAAGVVNRERVGVLTLRGWRLPLESPAARGWLVGQLRALDAAVLVVDPFAGAFTGDSENDNRQVRDWLDNLDAIAREAGVPEVVLGVHAGRNGSHSRGASALDDWTDAMWTLTVPDEDGPRVLSVAGRMENPPPPPMALAFDHESRSLTVDGSRVVLTEAELKAAKAAEAASTRYAEDRRLEMVVLDAATDRPGLSKRELRSEVKARGRIGATKADDAITRCVVAGWLDDGYGGKASPRSPSRARLAYDVTAEGAARLEAHKGSPA